jgi:hypothetical protein
MDMPDEKLEQRRNHQSGNRGDQSGEGRPRRDDGEVYPAHRNAGEFGTHGGPKRTQKGQAADDGANVEGDE